MEFTIRVSRASLWVSWPGRYRASPEPACGDMPALLMSTSRASVWACNHQHGCGDGGRVGHVEGQQHETLDVLLVQLLQLGGLGGVLAGGEYLAAALQVLAGQLEA